jgi:WD40 repeat protein
MFYRVLLTKDGVSGPWEQENGPPRDSTSSNGQSVFSPDGKKYACIYSSIGKAWVMDFDRNTGLLSNLKILNYDLKEDWGVRGISFSPNSKFLYVSADYFLYQYDLEAADIQGSEILIDYNDGYTLPGLSKLILFGYQQLGPDGKIYIGQYLGSIRQWSTINKPNEKGKECDFQQHSLTFPVYSIATPPIQPNFRLGQDTTNSISQVPFFNIEMNSWYNPSSKIIKCWLQHLPTEKGLYNITVNDITGRTLISEKIINPQYQEDVSLDGSALVPGVYIVNLMEKGSVLVSGKVMAY